MGGLFVTSHENRRGLDLFERQHAPGAVPLIAGRHRVWVAGTWSGTEPCVAWQGESFLAVAGTMIYRARWSRAAAERLLADFSSGVIDEDALFGAFAFIHWDGTSLRLFSDWLGGVCVYRNRLTDVWSTSFLAALESGERRTLHVQGAYEYLLQESTFGQDTICVEVERIRPDSIYGVGDGSRTPRRDPLRDVEICRLPLDDQVDRVLAALNPIFDAIADVAGSRIDTAISGGFDSRLVLAMLRARGISPRLHVYGRPDDDDVRAARAICAGEGMSLEHVDKSRWADRSGSSPGETLERNFLLFDGYPIDGIFDSGVDLATRLERMADGYLLLNGGGGEVLRNFYYLPDRRLTVRQLLYAFYSQFDPRVCGSMFNEKRFYVGLEAKFREELKVADGVLSRTDIERSYPLLRCRYWMARNTSVNCRLGRFLTPLIEPALIRAALGVPIVQKNSGLIEGALIRRVDLRLASYQSSYGYPLSSKPSLASRFSDLTSRIRPVTVRRFAYRAKSRLRACIVGNQRGVRNGQSKYPVCNVGRSRDEHLRQRAETLEFIIEQMRVEC